MPETTRVRESEGARYTTVLLSTPVKHAVKPTNM